ncbi:MAG: D-TA family PLP-dependent enzyme [Bacteroides sp.]|nr:D-TA family PLP-dependent enzyme [Bacteroides sp.]
MSPYSQSFITTDNMLEWYHIHNIEQLDSPALLVYPERVYHNIHEITDIIEDIGRLRPHVKTHKMGEVSQMMIQFGIRKFKCATIAEAEMLGLVNAEDVLLAYQPVGPKIARLLDLQDIYPDTRFSCLVDNPTIATKINNLCEKRKTRMDIYIDLNVGMNRTGISPEQARELAVFISEQPCIQLKGIHTYDGHIHDSDLNVRTKECDQVYSIVQKVMDEIQALYSHPFSLIIGGTPTFSINAKRKNCECSPGTFVLWDWGYKHTIKELPCEYAALVLTRVISIIDEHHICVDLGYKAVAAESPLPRVYFLNAPSTYPIAHNEEHLVLKVKDSADYPIGMALYGVPVHICPTVALYSKANIITNNQYRSDWEITARNRSINY